MNVSHSQNLYRAGDKDTRPWGSWEVLAAGPNYVIKHIRVLPGKRLSLQRHQHRAEVWVITCGTAEVTLDEQLISLGAGESIAIARLAWHRIRNSGEDTLEFVETQTGSRLDESDIERKEDDFGRA